MLRRLTTIVDPGFYSRHSAKIAGFAFGTLGTIVLTMFLVVAITGEGYNDFSRASGEVVYPQL
jgi:hypothetical protein